MGTKKRSTINPLWLYRTLESDDDGDPLDHGVLRGGRQINAVDQVRQHLREIGHEGVAFRLYRLVDRPYGVLKSPGKFWDVR